MRCTALPRISSLTERETQPEAFSWPSVVIGGFIVSHRRPCDISRRSRAKNTRQIGYLVFATWSWSGRSQSARQPLLLHPLLLLPLLSGLASLGCHLLVHSLARATPILRQSE